MHNCEFRCIRMILELYADACFLFQSHFLFLRWGCWRFFRPSPRSAKPTRTDLYAYIEELPDWASYASNVMYESTRYWEEQIPGLQFYVADDPSRADLRVQWVKEFGVEHVGYAYGSKFIEVGLGDSNCLDQWNPFSANYVSHIMTHEIGHVLGYQHSDDPGDIMYPPRAQPRIRHY